MNETSNAAFLRTCLLSLLAFTFYLMFREISIRWDEIFSHDMSHDIEHYKENIYKYLSNNIGHKITDTVINNQ